MILPTALRQLYKTLGMVNLVRLFEQVYGIQKLKGHPNYIIGSKLMAIWLYLSVGGVASGKGLCLQLA